MPPVQHHIFISRATISNLLCLRSELRNPEQRGDKAFTIRRDERIYIQMKNMLKCNVTEKTSNNLIINTWVANSLQLTIREDAFLETRQLREYLRELWKSRYSLFKKKIANPNPSTNGM